MTEAEIDRRIARLNSLRRLRKGTQNEADRFNGWIDHYPFWAWVKRFEMVQGVGLYRMLRFSNRYGLDLVGPDFSKYRGKFDHEFYDAHVAATFHANDELVRATMFSHGGRQDLNLFRVEERFTSPLDGRVYDFVGEKWAYAANEEILIAGRGYGFPVKRAGDGDG